MVWVYFRPGQRSFFWGEKAHSGENGSVSTHLIGEAALEVRFNSFLFQQNLALEIFCWASRRLSVVVLPHDVDAVLKTLVWLCSQNPCMVAWESAHGQGRVTWAFSEAPQLPLKSSAWGVWVPVNSVVSVFSNCSLPRGVAPGSDANPGSSVPQDPESLPFRQPVDPSAPGNSSKWMSWKHCGFSSVL